MIAAHRDRGTRSSRGWWLVLGISLLIAEAWRFVDLRKTSSLLATVGPLVFFALVPYALLVLCETAGWRTVCAAAGLRIGLAPLLMVRLAGIAASAAVPAGSLFADGVKPALLRRVEGVPLPVTLATLMGNKLMLVATHAVYVATATALGWSALAAASPQLLGSSLLPWLCVATASSLVVAALVLSALVTSEALGRRVHQALARFPFRFGRRWLTAREGTFRELDGHLSRLREAPRKALAAGAALYFSSWCCEALESFVILSLIGVHLRFVDVMSLDAVVGVLRSCAFALPSALGVTDATYVLLLGAYGIADPLDAGAAFVVLKRAKEVCWVAAGTAILLAMRQFTPARDATYALAKSSLNRQDAEAAE